MQYGKVFNSFQELYNAYYENKKKCKGKECDDDSCPDKKSKDECFVSFPDDKDPSKRK